MGRRYCGLVTPLCSAKSLRVFPGARADSVPGSHDASFSHDSLRSPNAPLVALRTRSSLMQTRSVSLPMRGPVPLPLSTGRLESAGVAAVIEHSQGILLRRVHSRQLSPVATGCSPTSSAHHGRLSRKRSCERLASNLLSRRLVFSPIDLVAITIAVCLSVMRAKRRYQTICPPSFEDCCGVLFRESVRFDGDFDNHSPPSPRKASSNSRPKVTLRQVHFDRYCLTTPAASMSHNVEPRRIRRHLSPRVVRLDYRYLSKNSVGRHSGLQ